MERSNLRHLLLAIPLLPLLGLLGCSQPNSTTSQSDAPASLDSAETQSEQLQVMTTFLPMYLFTKAVAGDAANVKILIPPGSEVHEYQSKPGDVQAIANADILIQNGLGLEEFLESTIASAQNAKLVVVEASAGIEAIADDAVAHTEDTHADHGHEQKESSGASAEKHIHAAGNPHVWLDPVLAQQQVNNIRDALIKADPTNQATYQANAATYIQQLQDLNQQFQQRLQKYPNCTFVAFHDAYPYLARRYQIQQVAVVALPEDNLSPADVQKAVAAAKQYKVKALVGEPGTDNKLLQSLSNDLGLTLQPLDPLESGPLEPQYYFTAMKANLQTLESACQ